VTGSVVVIRDVRAERAQFQKQIVYFLTGFPGEIGIALHYREFHWASSVQGALCCIRLKAHGTGNK